MRSFVTLLFLALVPACSAFLPATPATHRTRDVSMMAKNDFNKQTAKWAAALSPVILSAPAWATEGTGEVSHPSIHLQFHMLPTRRSLQGRTLEYVPVLLFRPLEEEKGWGRLPTA